MDGPEKRKTPREPGKASGGSKGTNETRTKAETPESVKRRGAQGPASPLRVSPSGRGGGCAAKRRASPRLPCHTSEQLNPPPTVIEGRGGKSQRLARLRVELEIQGMCSRWGVERIGFLTFTFADDVQTIGEAQRRFNSMNSNALSGRYAEWVCVVQRHKDGRIHFHLVVVMAEDIRTGFDFEAVRRRDYSSASAYLRAEWAFLRAALPEYSFGRHELLPVKNTGGFGMYVARYVGRTFHTRQDEKGTRLVRFSRNFRRVVCGPFSKVDIIEKRARERVPRIVRHLGWRSHAHMEEELGDHWRYHLARLLYCHEMTFLTVLLEAEESLAFYGGRMFCVREAFARHDARVAAAAVEEEWWPAPRFEGVGVHVDSV